MAQGKLKVKKSKKKNTLAKRKKEAKRTRIAGTFFQIFSSLSFYPCLVLLRRKTRYRLQGTKKSRSKKRALLDPSFKTNKRVKRVIDEKIEGLVASKVKLTGKRFIFGDLNDKASKTLKGIHLKRGKKELKKKRRFTMAEKIEAELAALRRGD